MSSFGKVEWKDFFARLYRKADQTDLFNRAASVAFYFSFALFPLLLFLITLAGIVLGNTESLKHDLYKYLFQIMPLSAFLLVQKTLEEIIETSSGGKLTLGLIITLWSASAGVDTLRSALNAVYELPERRSWWNTKLQSLVLTFLFITLITAAMVAFSSGWGLLERLFAPTGMNVDSPIVLTVVQWLLIIAVLLFATEAIYNWIPCHENFRWNWITPGSVVAILLWLIFSGGFRLYLHYFNSYNKAYGSLGAVIILMLWMFLSSTSILVGGAINSSLIDDRRPDQTQEADDPNTVGNGNMPEY